MKSNPDRISLREQYEKKDLSLAWSVILAAGIAALLLAMILIKLW